MANTTARRLERPALSETPRTSWRDTLSNALIITRREVRDSFRDWRIIGPIVVLTFLFPALAQFVAGQFSSFVADYGANILADRTIPFLLMIVGFFPISISLVIALETFVGEKERRSLEPLLSTPLTNTELYIGKTLAAMLPPLISSYGGMLVYLGGLLFGELSWRPPAMLIVQIMVLTTVQALVMITGAVVVSSQTTSTRAANLLASFIIIPMTLVIQGESAIMFLAPDAESPNGIGALWAIIIGMVVVVALLLRIGNSIFNREELLGRTLDTVNFKGIFKNLWRAFRAVDDRGTPAPNLIAWYRDGVLGGIKRIRTAVLVVIGVFILAAVVGFVLGGNPGWQLNLPPPSEANYDNVAGNLEAVSSSFFGEGNLVWNIFWQNTRVLLAATALAMFTFGVGALVLTPLTFGVLGYLVSQLTLVGYGLAFIAPALLTHGWLEIPIIVIAAGAALHLGSAITRPAKGRTLGQAWTSAFGTVAKLWVGVILPGLLIAAIIEAYITPAVVQAALGS